MVTNIIASQSETVNFVQLHNQNRKGKAINNCFTFFLDFIYNIDNLRKVT